MTVDGTTNIIKGKTHIFYEPQVNPSDDLYETAFMSIGEYNDDALWIGKNTSNEIWMQSSYKMATNVYKLHLNPLGGDVTINGNSIIHAGNISSQSVNYATSSAYFPTCYIGGDQPNPQTYFSNTIGCRVAMTRYADIGMGTSWHDTLWINGYAGGDVPNMCALHFKRDGEPRFSISSQTSYSTGYGSMYEVITKYNIASQTVANATNCLPLSGGIMGSNAVVYFNAEAAFQYSPSSGWVSWARNPFRIVAGSNTIAFGALGSEAAINYAFIGPSYDSAYSLRIYPNNYPQANAFYASSDRRLKKNISSIPISSLDNLFSVSDKLIKKFTWKQSKKTSYGFIAQELKKYIPESIQKDNLGIMSISYDVAYAKLFASLVNEIKKLKAQVKTLMNDK